MADGCILYSTADWDTPYWTNKQHMTVDFARRGIRVLYVETVGIRRPKLASGRDLTRILRRLWKAARGMRRVDDNVWVLSPLSIPVGRKFGVIGSFNSFLLRNSVRVASLRLGFASPMTWTYHPYLPDLDRSRTGPLVYHCVDDIAAVPGVDATTYARLEEALVAKSDLTFVTSPGLYELWRKAGPHVHYLPNAVDVGHFAKARDLKPTLDLSSATGPVIGYIGALSDFKVDFKLVLDAVRLRPDWTWVFIGDEREGQRSDDVATLRALPNVHFLGHRPYAELPGYMAAFDVGVLPTLVNAYTRSMYPMKYLEYVAAGLRVVSTRLDFTRDPAVRLEIASNATEFVAAIARQVSLGRFTRAESDAIVGENTWSARTTKMLELVAKRRPEPTFRVDQSLPSIPSVSSQVAEPN